MTADATADSASGVRQLLVTDEAWVPMQAWLARNGLDVKPYPFQDPDDLPTYFLAPTAWRTDQ